jgi:hypothetical protein
MSASHELILAIGPALFGAQWKRDLARAIGVTDRTVNRWALKGIEPRSRVWLDLLAFMRERHAQLGKLIEAVERRQPTSCPISEQTSDTRGSQRNQ